MPISQIISGSLYPPLSKYLVESNPLLAYTKALANAEADYLLLQIEINEIFGGA